MDKLEMNCGRDHSKGLHFQMASKNGCSCSNTFHPLERRPMHSVHPYCNSPKLYRLFTPTCMHENSQESQIYHHNAVFYPHYHNIPHRDIMRPVNFPIQCFNEGFIQPMDIRYNTPNFAPPRVMQPMNVRPDFPPPCLNAAYEYVPFPQRVPTKRPSNVQGEVPIRVVNPPMNVGFRHHCNDCRNTLKHKSGTRSRRIGLTVEDYGPCDSTTPKKPNAKTKRKTDENAGPSRERSMINEVVPTTSQSKMGEAKKHIQQEILIKSIENEILAQRINMLEKEINDFERSIAIQDSSSDEL